jgi:hypothetical protein
LLPSKPPLLLFCTPLPLAQFPLPMMSSPLPQSQIQSMLLQPLLAPSPMQVPIPLQPLLMLLLKLPLNSSWWMHMTQP